MTIRSINLTPDLDAFLEEQVASGAYHNSDDALNEAVRLLTLETQKRKMTWRRVTQKSAPSIRMDHTFSKRSPAEWKRKPAHPGLNPLIMSPFFSELPK